MTLPLEFQISGFSPSEWQPQDSIAVMMLTTYMGLADSQQNIEKTILQSVFSIKKRHY